MTLKVLHSADLHFSISIDKLPEVVRTTDALLVQARAEQPDVIVLAGDTVDEYDGRIRLDSDCARAAISFVQEAANIAPVVIIRGTKSHDRESPYFFQHLRARNPIHVATSIEQVALVRNDMDAHAYFYEWRPLTDPRMVHSDRVVAVFSLVPSLDKSQLLAHMDASIAGGNIVFRELVHDLFAGFGLVNDACQCPTFLVTHGMLTGAVFSSGQTAVGEDLEFGLSDLHAAKASAVLLGHVHKHQVFPGNVAYPGSPGRLNFGEQEDKGFLVWDCEGQAVLDMRFLPLPARRFCFGAVEWDGSAETILAEARRVAADCSGADVRFRYSIPEEERLSIDRFALESLFLGAGANRAKIEMNVIPKQRTRAEGISKLETLPDKVLSWGTVVGEEIPADVLLLAGRIEGLSAEELLAEARALAMGEVSGGK